MQASERTTTWTTEWTSPHMLYIKIMYISVMRYAVDRTIVYCCCRHWASLLYLKMSLIHKYFAHIPIHISYVITLHHTLWLYLPSFPVIYCRYVRMVMFFFCLLFFLRLKWYTSILVFHSFYYTRRNNWKNKVDATHTRLTTTLYNLRI